MSSKDDDMASAPHKWTSFEVRTLVCLIIKGEHRASSDPIGLADKLNTALHPPKRAEGENSPPTDTATATTQTHNRDIPVSDVGAMLERILAKKKHAVDLCGRDPSGLVTKKKINAFMRGLDFNGGHREEAAAERAMARARLWARGERRVVPSPREEDEDHRRREMIESPRAHKLLVDWGMGASFWGGRSVHDGERCHGQSTEPYGTDENSSRPDEPRRSADEEASGTGGEEAVRPAQGQSLTKTSSTDTTANNNSYGPFVVPDSRSGQAPAGAMWGGHTPAWMKPGANQRPTVPPTPAGATGFGGGYGAAAAPGFKEQEQPCLTPAIGGFGGGFGGAAPQQQQPAPSAYGGEYAGWVGDGREPVGACYHANTTINANASDSGDDLQRQQPQDGTQGGYARDGR